MQPGLAELHSRLPADVLSSPSLCTPQNLAYDITPADVVTVVISEMGAVPPTSVAVILRESVRDAAVL